MRNKLTWALVIVFSMVLGGGVVIGADSLRTDSAVSQPPAASQSSDEVARTSGSSAPSSNNGAAAVDIAGSDVSDLYAAVRPSIVEINGLSARASSVGSGIIIDKQGNILTNNHVIDGVDQLDVVLADGTTASAQVVGRDAGNDLAVVKVNIPADKLTPARLGDSDKVRVGEFVIAVGNPFGIEGSLTQGIVSGVGRTLAGGAGRPLRQLIQSDAAINPGNSGGALFNRNGEVIGITTAIENPSGDRVFVGIGYAVPINSATRFLPDLLAGRQVQHPRMGVGLQNVTPALATRLSLGTQKGVLITGVEPGSAADKAGLKGGNVAGRAGDVIISIDGKETATYEALANYIDSKKVGDSIQVKFMRDGKEQTVTVTLEAWVQTA